LSGCFHLKLDAIARANLLRSKLLRGVSRLLSLHQPQRQVSLRRSRRNNPLLHR
jgi:hypothetical protein